jgi:hypothetical protein
MSRYQSILLIGSDGEPIFYSPKARLRQVAPDTFELTDHRYDYVFGNDRTPNSFDRVYLDTVVPSE